MSTPRANGGQSSEDSHVFPCPGLKITRNAGISWTDSTGRVHDLAGVRMLTLDEVAADPLVADLGFATAPAVGELVRTGRLYPCFRKNARVIRVFACALADFRRRSLGVSAAAAIPLSGRHLAAARSQRVA